MDKKTLEKIQSLLTFLSPEQKEDKIIEVNELINEELFDFLEKEGPVSCSYEIEYDSLPPNISEKSGNINLWYKNINNTWFINTSFINTLLKNN